MTTATVGRVASSRPGDPPAGAYPDGNPGYRGMWDGHAWTGAVADPDQAALPHRHSLWRAVGRWWAVGALVAYAAGFGLALAAMQDESMLVRTAATVGTVGVTLWFIAMLHERLRLGEALGLGPMVGWGVVIGVVAAGGAYWVESLRITGGGGDDQMLSSALAGPIEEIAKLLVPVILWLTVARMRDPRAGLAVVLAGAAVFGILEGWVYTALDVTAQTTQTVHHLHHDTVTTSGSPRDEVLDMALSRPWIELLHPLLTGFAAAVVWRCAWLTGRLVTWPGVAAVVLAMVLHSANDSLITWAHGTGAPDWAGAAILAWSAAIFGLGWFVLLRPAARRLVSPTAVPANARGWRPRPRTDVPTTA